MRRFMFFFCVFKFACGMGQINSLANTIWQRNSESYVYSLYLQNLVYEVTDYSRSAYPEAGITLTARVYGFYDSCRLPSLESVRETGIYYFELDSAADETSNQNIQNACSEMNIYYEGRHTRMTIYYSSRQQYVTFEKIDALPKNVLAYLKKQRLLIKR